MPELPEAETVARELARNVTGKRIVAVAFKEPKGLNRAPEEFAEHIVGHMVLRVERRAKAIVLFLDGDDTLWLHMGLRSVVGYVAKEQLPTNPFLGLTFEDGMAFFMDKTFMGYAHVFEHLEFARRWDECGVEPLGEDFTLATLQEILKRKSGQGIKAILMDQQIIAGIGNIFSDEILHAAGIHPVRKAATLTGDEVERLHRAICEVLNQAVEAGGGPEWVGITGIESGFKAAVHGQTVCNVHRSPVQKASFGGRTGYICEQTQKI
jgi:formamidopyrimidine-DNA glycosylase